MSPKEKAIELVNKFKQIIPAEYDHVDGGYDLMNLEFNAKEAAIVAVDEIINTLKSSNTDDPMVVPYSEIVYWREVKQEIEKL